MGVMAPSLAEGEVLADPYETKKKLIETDILVVGGGTELEPEEPLVVEDEVDAGPLEE